MSALIMKGAPVAAALNERTREMVAALTAGGITPCLALLRVGDKADDIAYEKGIIKRCEGLGIAVRQIHFSEAVDENSVISELCKLNEDESVHGILVFLPLPEHIDAQAVKRAIKPMKDMDGVTESSMATVFAGIGEGYAPCTAQAVIEMLKHYGVPLKGKRAVVLGRSLVIGRPVALLLTAEDATVTLCHSKTPDAASCARDADLVIAALGKARAVGADYFRAGQAVVDVGINFDEEGKLCGDVDFAAAEERVEAITPVPGGVGAVTTAVLARHVVEAAKKAQEFFPAY